MTNLDSILKSRDITFVDKGPSQQSYVFFLVVMYGCESWTKKNAKVLKKLRKKLSNCGVGEDS